jgi:hypothetical protein
VETTVSRQKHDHGASHFSSRTASGELRKCHCCDIATPLPFACTPMTRTHLT